MTNLEHILNWRRLNENITLSGQPSEAELIQIRDLGVTHIINLGPHHNKGALPDEAASVGALGMEYVYIPVEFEAPTDEDFEKFSKKLDELKGKCVHIHCIYNARVTAFVYRHSQTPNALIDERQAYKLMDSIWKPGDDWASFVGRQDAVAQPNRYAGEDY